MIFSYHCYLVYHCCWLRPAMVERRQLKLPLPVEFLLAEDELCYSYFPSLSERGLPIYFYFCFSSLLMVIGKVFGMSISVLVHSTCVSFLFCCVFLVFFPSELAVILQVELRHARWGTGVRHDHGHTATTTKDWKRLGCDTWYCTFKLHSSSPVNLNCDDTNGQFRVDELVLEIINLNAL